MTYARIRHPEWVERTLGSMRYTRDLRPEGLLVARVLRCPWPAAQIRSIDVDAARSLPGVAAVLTGADLPDRNYRDYGQMDRPAMARERAVWFGQEVAVVAAETEAIADAALAQIRVEWKPQPYVSTVAEALRPGAPAVHPERAADNRATVASRHFGDTATARVDGARRVSGDYGCGPQHHACMEPHSALAHWDANTKTLHLWTPTQAPRAIAGEIAYMLDLAPERVHLHRIGVGGDFGSRVKPGDIEVLAAHLSRITCRPVLIQLDRAEDFAFAKRQHETWVSLTSGYDDAGIVHHREAQVTVDNGAFMQGGSNQMNYCSILLAAQYRLKGAEVQGQSVYTNRRPGGAFRGAGGPQAVFAIESQMDEIAERVGMDPIDLRLNNLTSPGDTTITGWHIGTSAAVECLEEVRRRLDWESARTRGGSGRGVGVALATHVSGAVVNSLTGRAGVAVEMGQNGGVVLSSGCADPGTGEYAVIAQLAAAELGVAVDSVELRTMDTANTPWDPGAGSSRATMVTGGAALAAARELADDLRFQAGSMLGGNPEAVILENGTARLGAQNIPLGVVAAAHPKSVSGTLRVERETEVPVLPVGMTHEDDGYGNLSPAYAFAAHGVEVEVDHATGVVRVLRVVAAHDAGTVINPAGAEGQVTGGVAMGLGMALGEQLIWLDGKPQVTGYVDYGMPRAEEVPPIEVAFVGGPDPSGPGGGKSISEIALMPVAAAVANAIAHATGARLRELPLSPDRVLAALAPERKVQPRSLWQRPTHWRTAVVRHAYPRGLFRIMKRLAPPRRLGALPPPIQAVKRPSDAAAAIEILSQQDDARPVGGATELLAQRAQGLAAPAVLVSLTDSEALTSHAEGDDGTLYLGGAMTLAQAENRLNAAGQLGDMALAHAITTIATPQIRETGTLGGNLCQGNRCSFLRSGFDCYKRGGATRPCYALAGDHRYHHAVIDGGRCQAVTPSDLGTVLSALGATIVIEGPRGRRRVIAENFYKGPGETILGPAEIVATIAIPETARVADTAFEKFALSPDGFAVASAAVMLRRATDGRVLSSQIVLGAVAPTPWRAKLSEAALTGFHPDSATLDAAASAWIRAAHPLPHNDWKLDAAAGVLRRALARAVALQGPLDDQPTGAV